MLRPVVTVALAALVVGIAVSRPAARQAGTWTLQFNTASGIRDSTSLDEPFTIQLTMPPTTGPMPETVTVTLSNGQGQNQSIQLTRVAGTNTYVSQTMTVSQGAQATGAQSYLPGGLSRSIDPVKVANGGTITVSVNNVSTSITVYQSQAKQGIARVTAAMDARATHLRRLVQTATDAIAKIDDQLKTTTDAGVRQKLQAARQELVKQRDIAMRQSAAIAEGRQLMQDPNDSTHSAWRYTDEWKLAVATQFFWLSRNPNAGIIGVLGADWDSAFNNAVTNATRQWSRFYTGFVVDVLRGVYEATASLTLAGPTLTLVGGKTIYWQDATLGDRLKAFGELAVAAVMIKGLPIVVDAAGQKVAGDFGGYRGNTSLPEVVVPGSGRSSSTEVGGRAAEVSGRAAQPGLSVPVAQSQAAYDSFARAAETARASGVPDTVVQGIVDETLQNAEANLGQPGIDALAEGELSLAAEQFQATHPGAQVVKDVDTLQTIRSVRVKARLEAREPQTWTSDERAMLDFLNTPGAENIWELEDPFEYAGGNVAVIRQTTMIGLDSNSEPGYSPALSGDDAKNIAAAATKNLKVDTPPDPAIQAKLEAFRAEQRAKVKPTDDRTKTAVPGTGAVQNTTEPARPMLDLKALKDQIVQKRLETGHGVATRSQSPFAGTRGTAVGGAETRGYGSAMDVSKLTVDQIKALTPDEIRRITPLEIHDMSAEARDALPVEQLGILQTRAVAEAEGIPIGATPTATGLEGAATSGAMNPGPAPGSVPAPSVVERTARNRAVQEFGAGASTWTTETNADGSVILRSADGSQVVRAVPTTDNGQPGAQVDTWRRDGRLWEHGRMINGTWLETSLEGDTPPARSANATISPAPASSGATGGTAGPTDGTTGAGDGSTGAYLGPHVGFVPTGSITIHPDGVGELSLSGTSGAYPGTSGTYPFMYAPNGGLVIYPSGATVTPAGSTSAPIAVTRPPLLPALGATTTSDGTVTFSGVPLSGFPGPGGPGPVSLDLGALIFDPPPPKLTVMPGTATGGGDSSILSAVGSGGSTDLGPQPGLTFSGYFVPNPTGTSAPPLDLDIVDLANDPVALIGGGAPSSGAPWFGPTVPSSQDLMGLLGAMTIPGLASMAPAPETASGIWRRLDALLVPPGQTLFAHGTTAAWPDVAAGAGRRSAAHGEGEAGGAVAPSVRALFVSRGIVSGDAFEVELINDGAQPMRVVGDGLVLEPLSPKGGDEARKDMADAIRKRGARAPAPSVAHVNAYCLDYTKQPPVPGTIYRVADTNTQIARAAARRVLQAEEALERQQALPPLTDPKTFFDILRQWSVWTVAQKFSADDFAREFPAHAKANMLAAHQPWTAAIEAQIKNSVPLWWADVSRVVAAASATAR